MYYIQQLYDFFDRLAVNNNREWFAEHKQEYLDLRAKWLEDIDRLIAAMTVWEPALASQSAQTAAYRIYRDTRFKTDKTPYKTFFSALVSPWGKKTDRAAYYIEIGRSNTLDQGLYAGAWCLDSPTLRKMRHAIVDNIEEWEQIVTAPDVTDSFRWCSSELKTIPKGWERDHPQAYYLRMTNYGQFRECDDKFFLDPSWPEKAAELFHALKPFVDFINYSIDE